MYVYHASEDITFLYYIQVQIENTVFCLLFDHFLAAQELPTLRWTLNKALKLPVIYKPLFSPFNFVLYATLLAGDDVKFNA
jgi:hypothetical protein